MKIKKEDVPKLDFLLNKMLEHNSFVDSEVLINAGLYDPNERKSVKEDFQYFVSVFAHFGVATPKREGIDWLLTPNLESLPFQRDGGFEQLHEDSVKATDEYDQRQKSEIRKQVQEEIIRQKSIEKFQYDIYGFWIAVASIIIALISLIK